MAEHAADGRQVARLAIQIRTEAMPQVIEPNARVRATDASGGTFKRRGESFFGKLAPAMRGIERDERYAVRRELRCAGVPAPFSRQGVCSIAFSRSK